MNLTEKEERYCQSYVICANQSTAYREAFDADAMNSNSVAVEACRLHATPKISLRIKEIQKETYERNKVTIDELIQSMAEMVRHDPADYYDENGAFKSIHDIPEKARRLISEITVFEEYQPDGAGGRELIGFTKKIKSIDKLGAIEKLMKHLGGYEVDNRQKSNSLDIDYSKLSDETIKDLLNARK